eukprot:g9533.t1
MSPKMEANGGVGAGAVEDCSIDSSCSEAGTERCGSPAPAAEVPPATQAVRPADNRQSPPTVKRKTCLRISTSPPVDSAANGNKRATPSNIAVTAGSSSVVACKGMLFSRAELRPAPLSASRKYNGNVGFGFQSSSCSDMVIGNNTNGVTSSLGCPVGDQPQSSTGMTKPSPGRGGNFSAGPATSAAAVNPAVRSSESFATLRIMEARRRAAWSFEPSPRTSSASPPPPSLAALDSRSAGSYRRRSPKKGPGSTAARKAPMPMPPLPKMKSFAPTIVAPSATAPPPTSATAVARPPPLPPRRNMNNSELLISAAYGGPSGRAAAGAAVAAVAPEKVVAAPLSEPRGREKDRTRETLEQKWAAWQLENQQENQGGPAPVLGKPAPPPTATPGSDLRSLGECSGGGGSRKGWGGGGDFHDKVAFLGDYVASVFGRAKRGGSVPQRFDGGVQVKYGVE